MRTKPQYETDNSSLERVEEFKYLETNLTNQKLSSERNYNQIEAGKACYHSAESFVSQIAI